MNYLIYILIFCFIISNISFIAFMLLGFKNLKFFNKTNDIKKYNMAQNNFKYMIISGIISFVSLLICGNIIL